MKYTAKPTAQFKKDVKRMQKQNKDMQLLWDVVEKLANGISLPDEYRDHMLSGNFKGIRECHIQPDWLLMYEVCDDTLYLYLTRTGSHSDLFGK
ncbi:MAG: type II toxin-antitoxin system YafQ family toxin [Oscillospiraceae bacterium]|nr:type II toxin-antitoxin system YafQ family toxin [Oscillospiraceae bacterium]MBQ9906298.1 type II toxin-antitoxin system YafQ family toxin [Oscillospiraceae bacterium]